MPQFAYFGRNANREPVEGRMEAASVANVADLLNQTGITPVSITEVPQVQQASEVIGRLMGKERVTDVDLMMFTRQFYTLTKAGVPIIRALRGLELSTQQRSLKKLYVELAQALESGVELSQAMTRRDDVFDPFYISMVRVGESAGRLEEVFLGLFEHLEFQKYISEQVKSALRYPSFVVLAMIVAVAIINVFVIPAFAKVFASLHAELPLMTRILMATSQFTLTWWPAVLAAVVAAWVGWKQFLKTEMGRLKWDRFKLRLPIVGELIEKGVLAQGMRSLALVFRSGVPVVQGLTLSAQVIDNAYISQALTAMRSQVERGDSLLTASQRSGVFPPLVLQMIMVGEESGTLAEMLEEIGQMYQRDMEYGLKTLAQKIEPILLVLMGAMVLVLALGVFLPMWDLGKAAIK
ncbi:MAG: type II secretion system F family protein [Burkholderiales bacterium]|nr:type II secretion system F family protein [Burkholderiales bacterium]MDE2431372.1 type II secretion system F family protein [Burkholderiales bacterium]HET8693384.1 type II secretion system F family protein [Aquabacterium sp.]